MTPAEAADELRAIAKSLERLSRLPPRLELASGLVVTFGRTRNAERLKRRRSRRGLDPGHERVTTFDQHVSRHGSDGGHDQGHDQGETPLPSSPPHTPPLTPKPPPDPNLIDRPKDLSGQGVTVGRSSTRITCPVDLRLSESQRQNLLIRGIPDWALDAMTTDCVGRWLADETRAMPLTQWRQLLSTAITRDWNAGRRPKRPAPERDGEDEIEQERAEFLARRAGVAGG